MNIVIYYNPDCGTSRNVFAKIEAANHTPRTIEDLKIVRTRQQLPALFADVGLTPRTALRTNKSPAEALVLTYASVTDETLLDARIEPPF